MNLSAVAEGSLFSPRRIAAGLLTTVDEVARSAGLGRDAVARRERLAQPRTQRRLREMVEILNRVQPRFGSDLIAYAWYRSQPLAGFGGLSAMALVQDGRAQEVMDFLDAVDAGIHA